MDYLFYLVFSVPIFVMCLILSFLDYLDKDKTLTLNYECIFIKAQRALTPYFNERTKLIEEASGK